MHAEPRRHQARHPPQPQQHHIRPGQSTAMLDIRNGKEAALITVQLLPQHAPTADERIAPGGVHVSVVAVGSVETNGHRLAYRSAPFLLPTQAGGEKTHYPSHEEEKRSHQIPPNDKISRNGSRVQRMQAQQRRQAAVGADECGVAVGRGRAVVVLPADGVDGEPEDAGGEEELEQAEGGGGCFA